MNRNKSKFSVYFNNTFFLVFFCPLIEHHLIHLIDPWIQLNHLLIISCTHLQYYMHCIIVLFFVVDDFTSTTWQQITAKGAGEFFHTTATLFPDDRHPSWTTSVNNYNQQAMLNKLLDC
ncbi:hypothetical protein T4C_6866 [Trichinella pseudospiralis]|uniref:Uncharacterized protein n=1 Tax=Trichinella pseudospiralis TaxID=6337 RepID=A0A0V1J295_TRIPS|nr:hypothetical protein T4C_6866 [Trichinella pseudospiralis]